MGIIRKIALLFIKPLCRLAFDRRYLTGRWFEGRDTGWRWAWRSLWQQKICGHNRSVPWPVSMETHIANPSRLQFHPDDLNNFQSFGQYYNNNNGGSISIGRGSYIAPNVGLVTANHVIYDLDNHEDARDILIGEHCWIGMNAVILPGVVLGEHTVVAAGAVVNNSHPQGHVVLGGMPARVIKVLDRHPDKPAAETAGQAADANSKQTAPTDS